MKNTTILIVALILIIGLGVLMFGKGTNNTTGNATDNGNKDIQRITLSMKNGNYYPNTITVKAGQPVSITLDSSVGGCYRSFVIQKFGVRAVSRSPIQTIDFTPTEKGTFPFSCSMGMGTGTLIVE